MKLRSCLLLCLYLLLAPWTGATAAMPKLELRAPLPVFTLYDHAEFFEDRGGALTLEQVRRLPDSAFQPLLRSNYMRGISASAYWTRLRLHNVDTNAHELALYHLVAFTDHIQFFVLEHGVLRHTAVGGDRVLPSERMVRTRCPEAGRRRTLCRQGGWAQSGKAVWARVGVYTYCRPTQL